MSQAEVQQIEETIRQSKKLVDLGEALVRLRSNRDFRKVITEGYLRDEAVRLVHLKAEPFMANKQVEIVRDIDAIGSLHSYLRTLEHSANLGAKAIVDGESTLEEIRAEETDK
jgi:hypothetical protein